jgi:hypothetical protein
MESWQKTGHGTKIISVAIMLDGSYYQISSSCFSLHGWLFEESISAKIMLDP